MDFRGRIYADSPISYTFNKTTRWLYTYGVYTEVELNMLKPKLPVIGSSLYTYILTNSNLEQQYKKIQYTNDIVKYYIYIVFFELGKLKKGAFISIKQGRLSSLDFITIGVDYFNNPPQIGVDFEEQLEYLALLDILDSLNANIFVKVPIYKDATASALQLLLILLGPANESVLYEGNLKDSGY